jgi:aspartyl-tRNA(Asn)/glutamyl-tRNA(Gln) amidotransferase subunit B
VAEGTVSGKIAKEIFSGMVTTKRPAKEIIDKKGLIQLKDKAESEKLAEEVLRENPEQVQKYLSGEEKIFGLFVGEAMKKGKGKANPKLVNAILKEKLKR